MAVESATTDEKDEHLSLFQTACEPSAEGLKLFLSSGDCMCSTDDSRGLNEC